MVQVVIYKTASSGHALTCSGNMVQPGCDFQIARLDLAAHGSNIVVAIGWKLVVISKLQAPAMH